MGESDWASVYRRDAGLLAEIGQVLARGELPRVEVRLPKALARAAVEAWEREGDEKEPEPESLEQRTERQRAGTLALIGLSIQRSGHYEGGEVIVDLSPDLIGLAIGAADSL
jgi:hypothetical protein